MDSDLEQKLRDALLGTYFENRPAGFPCDDADRKDLEDHLFRRFDECEQVVLPWVASHVDLEGAEVLEIGCGSGSSTASFAGHTAHVYAYDIVDRCVRAARERLRVMGLSNASCFAVAPDELLDRIEENHRDGVDLVLLYAVMEHQSVEERLATLERCWALLRPGGHLVVTDSPNRLCYRHYHTSEIPFFDMVPQELALGQLDRSPHAAFRESMRAAMARSEEEASLVLTRWGTGISHHEFEAVLGDLGELVVGSGFDPEIAAHKPIVIEEELLLSYLVMTEQPIPLAFARVSVDVILRKPDGSPREPFRSAEEERHAERVRRRFSKRPAERAAPAREAEEPTRLQFDWARRVADESLNGRTLLRLALGKLVAKALGRARD